MEAAQGESDHKNASVRRTRKAGKKGRSDGPSDRSFKSLAPPEGERFAWFTEEFIASPALRSVGVSARRILDCLVYELLRHNRLTNGRLVVPHSQLKQKIGIKSSDTVQKGILELEAVGIIRVQSRYRKGGRHDANRYTLTFIGAESTDADGVFLPPTNDWKRFGSDQQAKEAIEKSLEKRTLRRTSGAV